MLSSILHLYQLILWIALIKADDEQLSYIWPEYTDMYDCMVGITVDYEPVSTGIFVTLRSVLTSANPLEKIATGDKGQQPRIKLHAINFTYDASMELEVEYYAGNQGKRLQPEKQVWVGFDQLHNTLHDLMVITIPASYWVPSLYDKAPPRTPFYVRMYDFDVPVMATNWSFAGFGFIDRAHIERNLELEVAEYETEPMMVDCDEWLPRPWGNFICLSNVDNFAGIASGAGLYYDNLLCGIGAFELTKGNESILVFTNVSLYVESKLKSKEADNTDSKSDSKADRVKSFWEWLLEKVG